MRRSIAILACAAALRTAAAAATATTAAAATGDCHGDGPQPPYTIPSLPFAAVGSTCGCISDRDPPCIPASGLPDVEFAYTAPEDGCITVDLCGSIYDTALSVFDETTGATIDCNDEACGHQSYLREVAVSAGHTYIIVVDTAVDCGDYRLEVTSCGSCVPACPPDGMPEGEVDCFPGYVDEYNPGCGSPSRIFQDVTCAAESLVICGTYGLYTAGLEQDWYRITPLRPGRLQVCVLGERSAQIVLWEACNAVICDLGTEECGTACCVLDVVQRSYAILVRPNVMQEVFPPCGARYRLTLRGVACAVAVQGMTWQRVKATYR